MGCFCSLRHQCAESKIIYDKMWNTIRWYDFFSRQVEIIDGEAGGQQTTRVYIDEPWTCNTSTWLGVSLGPGVISQYLDDVPPINQTPSVTRKDGAHQYTEYSTQTHSPGSSSPGSSSPVTDSPVTHPPGRDLTISESSRVSGVCTVYMRVHICGCILNYHNRALI